MPPRRLKSLRGTVLTPLTVNYKYYTLKLISQVNKVRVPMGSISAPD
jgi:hypothetical protein